MINISIGFCLITILILSIFIINISHILYLIIYKDDKQYRYNRLILLNICLTSLIVTIWLIPFFYFRIFWSPESFLWRLWSYLYHIVDGIQLYSFLLFVIDRGSMYKCMQKCFLCICWIVPILNYSPLLWLSISTTSNEIDYLPYRRLSGNIPWWILPVLYTTMYLVPLLISIILTSANLCWPSINKIHKSRLTSSQQQINEHRETMAELTSLVETVLNFELDHSSINKTDQFIPSLSSLTNPSTSSTDQHSLSYMSNKLNRSLSYRASQDHSYVLFDDILSTTTKFNDSIQNQNTDVDHYLLFLIALLLCIVHIPYVILSILNIYLSSMSIFIYIHWFGTMLIPIIYLKRN